MKVYIVWRNDGYEPNSINEIFSSFEAAKEYVTNNRCFYPLDESNLREEIDSRIEEFEVKDAY